jgi:hypothetical protein
MKKSLIIIFCLVSVYASGKVGFGAGFDLSPNSARISLRNWFNKTNGFEIGFGPTANLEDFIFNDLSIQGKYMVGFRYDRFSRTYVGAIARYTIVKDVKFHKNMPSGGVFAGNEWYLGKFRNQGIAIEGGLMYGRISRMQYVEGSNVSIPDYYKEFPLYISFSYKYYLR